MSHVTEGQLHAYLDGALGHEAPADAGALEAHLRTCGDCRARLEAARRLRDRTSQILTGAAPDASGLPAFEEILRRADRERPATPKGGMGKPGRARRLGVRIGSLAWAASVLLAVGLGWAARTYWAPGGHEEPVALRETSVKADKAKAAVRAAGGELDAVASLAHQEAEQALPPEADDWVVVDEDTAERWIGGKRLQVDGLPVRDVSISARDGTRVIRSRQLLASGQLLEIYQARPGPAEERKLSKMTAAAEPAANRVTVEGRIAGFQVELVAAVAPDSLRALLSRLH